MARLKAIASGKLRFDEREVDCYVLEDGRRVLSQRGIVRAFRAGAKDGDLGRYLRRLPNKFSSLALAPEIEFQLPNGGVATGRDRKFFTDLCRAYTDAWVAGELHPKQERIAKTAMVVIGALADVGIDALIDEATGHQANRARDYLQRLFEHSLRQNAAKWELTFPDSVARALAPLWGVAYVSGPHPKALHRAYGMIYDIVLGEETASEMRRRNNVATESTKHHQWLQAPAHDLLCDDLRVVEMLASQSGSKGEFWARMRAHFRKEPLQLGLVG